MNWKILFLSVLILSGSLATFTEIEANTDTSTKIVVDESEDILFEEPEELILDDQQETPPEEEELLLEEQDELILDESEDELILGDDPSDVLVEEATPGVEESTEQGASTWKELTAPARFTLSHEYSLTTKEPKEVVSNRSMLRLQWEKLIANQYFLLLDLQSNLFLGNDHQTEAEEEKSFLIRNRLKELFVQTSFGDTSFKLGKQIVVWGEADTAVVTDIISPRDNTEFSFGTTENSRLGQWSLLMDHYSDFGTWSFLVIMNPDVDQSPQKETQYYVEMFDPTIFEMTEQETENSDQEYALKWKKTFGQSDFSLMYASVLSNSPSYRSKGVMTKGGVQKLNMYKHYPRYQMFGLATNLSSGNIIWKLEAAYKKGRTFMKNGADYVNEEGVLKKDVFDTAFGFEYDADSKYRLILEYSNQHIIDWNDDVSGVDRDEGSVSANLSKNLLNETLTLSYSYTHLIKYRDIMHQASVEYKNTDQLSTKIQYAHFDFPEKKSYMWAFRDQNRLTGEIKYTF